MQTGERRHMVGPGEGTSVDLGGLGVDFKISGGDTGGLLSVVEHPVQPGRLVPPHVHRDEDEYSYVLEGTFGARVGDWEGEAGPGSYLFKPRGIPHTFWNAGPDPARLIEIIAPAGFENFFEELGALAANYLPGDPEGFDQERTRLAKGYGLEFVPEWIPELKAKYGLLVLGE